ncbi:MAG: magnesium transporter [Actinomycetota bacterium]
MMKTKTPTYPAESVGAILSENVLAVTPSHKLKDVLEAINEGAWDDIHYAYAVDDRNKLVGVVDLAGLSKTKLDMTISSLMKPPAVTLHPHADQENAVLKAVKYDITAVPVVNGDGTFVGAVVAAKIIDVMHQEHLEDALLGSGIRGRGSDIIKLATARYSRVIRARAPWLIFGAVAGLGLGLISSLFEKTLQESVALAYFVPVVAYIADSVGTQSEAITVRALATLKIKYASYIMRELIVGFVLGLILGTMGGVGAIFISGSFDIGLVVGLSLCAASTIASFLAALIPMTLKTLGKDPALGSGPLATALQDLISVLIYFLFAVWLIK